MQPQKQQLKPAKTDNETPLLVLKPCRYRVKRKMALSSILFAMGLLFSSLLNFILRERVESVIGFNEIADKSVQLGIFFVVTIVIHMLLMGRFKWRLVLWSIGVAMILLFRSVLNLILWKQTFVIIDISILLIAFFISVIWFYVFLRGSFELYPDRAEKEGVFEKKLIYLKDAKVKICLRKNFLRKTEIAIISNENKWNRITYDFSLGDNSRADADNVINLFRSMGIELKQSSGFFCERYDQICGK